MEDRDRYRPRPLDARELRIVRGMIDEYERRRILRSLLSGTTGGILKLAAALSAIAVLAASVKSLVGG